MAPSEQRLTKAAEVRVSSRFCERVDRFVTDLQVSGSDVLPGATRKGLPAIAEQHAPGRGLEDSSGRM